MDPIHQFVITPIVPISVANVDVSFTNSSLWMALAVACSYFLVMAGTRQHAMVPGRLQAAVEMLYEFTANMLRDATGKEGMKYFPWIFTLFTFLLFGNLLGMVPGSYTFTSQIIVTFFMAIAVIVAVTAIGFMKHGTKFFGFFVPHGAPGFILPLMVPIEILSYLVRPISLSVRLFCNMMAGHTMMKVFAYFVLGLGGYYVVPGIAPLLITVALTGFEIVVAILQAYVFTVLTCLYLNDALHMH